MGVALPLPSKVVGRPNHRSSATKKSVGPILMATSSLASFCTCNSRLRAGRQACLEPRWVLRPVRQHWGGGLGARGDSPVQCGTGGLALAFYEHVQGRLHVWRLQPSIMAPEHMRFKCLLSKPST